MSQYELEDSNQTIINQEMFTDAANANMTAASGTENNKNDDQDGDLIVLPTGQIDPKYEKDQIKDVLKVLGCFNRRRGEA